MARKRTAVAGSQGQLDVDVDGLPLRGVLYADVNRQVRALEATGKLDPDLQAGTIQQARSLAAAIDRASGLAGRKQETYALAPMHKQLAELLTVLSGRQSEGAGLVELLERLERADEQPDT